MLGNDGRVHFHTASVLWKDTKVSSWKQVAQAAARFHFPIVTGVVIVAGVVLLSVDQLDSNAI